MPVASQAHTEAFLDDGRLQTVPVVARFLSISRSKVYQLMESGDLPYVKLGKSRRVRWGDVMKLVESNIVSRTA